MKPGPGGYFRVFWGTTMVFGLVSGGSFVTSLFMSSSPSSPESIAALLTRSFDLSDAELAPDSPLFSCGRLDSFHLVELITILEKQFARRIAPGEVNLENFDSSRRIAALLQTPAA